MSRERAIPILEDLYVIEWSSFIRYVVEVSRPPIVDREDQKALALYQDIYREIERNVRALAEVLGEAGVIVGDPSWPLQYTSYNFLRPRYLVRPLLEKMRAQARQVEERAEALRDAGWPLANEVLETVLRRERSALERLEKFASEMPAESAEPPKLKGTSASRW